MPDTIVVDTSRGTRVVWVGESRKPDGTWELIIAGTNLSYIQDAMKEVDWLPGCEYRIETYRLQPSDDESLFDRAANELRHAILERNGTLDIVDVNRALEKALHG